MGDQDDQMTTTIVDPFWCLSLSLSLSLSLTPRDSSSLSLLLSRFLHLLRITLVSSSVCPGKTRMGGLQITERQGPPVSPNYPDLSVFPSLLSKTCRALLQGLEWMADTHSSLYADANLIRNIKLSVYLCECMWVCVCVCEKILPFLIWKCFN